MNQNEIYKCLLGGNRYTDVFEHVIKNTGNLDTYLGGNGWAKFYGSINENKLLLKDLTNTFDYVALHKNNFQVFSTRYYELLLRACTEIESNCKIILKANNYNLKSSKWNQTDYKKIFKKLSKLEINVKTIEGPIPLGNVMNECFEGKKIYTVYNDVKHNRHQNFHKANLEHVVFAILINTFLLYHTYGDYAFSSDPLVGDFDEVTGFQRVNDRFFDFKIGLLNNDYNINNSLKLNFIDYSFADNVK